MKELYMPGQRVRVARAQELCDATVGAVATVDHYEGPNYDGTDWQLCLIPEIPEPEGAEPSWSLDEASLVAVEGEPPPGPADDDHCRDADGAWLTRTAKS